ncbi:intermembrane transport protein PqiB [Achromobacter sp. UMC71]|uniref:PqiB family protein n=1 Tax=Achromobacter sp. UMC71 TaxID=1862320 RepID=UPI0015FFBBB4|nr:MlaD family protein [Achromobacter sp. UMC71]MBB1626557.1 paraquat-inducible protein B [Achromobacter sp. UMC71]
MPEPEPASVAAAPRGRRRRISWIWLVPAVAALGGLLLVLHAWLQAGPTATIAFRTAESLEAGKTQVRFKEVVVGVVERVALNADRSGVVATIRLNQDAADLLRDGTAFWVVRPRLTLNGVSGLSTLLSGAYIGVDPAGPRKDGARPAAKSAFTGLETPPQVAQDRSGKRYALHASDLGSLEIGSPVYYRRVAVGEVIGYQLDSGGSGVTVEVFVDAPYDAHVNAGSRFWNAGGIDFTVDSRGLKVRSQSLLSVAIGGMAFETFDARERPPAPPGTAFALFPNEEAARAQPDGQPLRIRMRFDQSVRGLAVGAPIDGFGAALGQVDAIGLEFDNATGLFYAVVSATVYPERLGRQALGDVREYTGPDLARPSGRLMTALVERGLRAQLRIGNLLTGQLYVALAVFPDAAPVAFKMEEVPFLPTVPNNLDQLQQQISRIMTRLDKVPFDSIGIELSGLLRATSSLARRLDTQVAPAAQALLRDATRSLAAVGNMLQPDGTLVGDAGVAARELGRAARSLRDLSNYLQTRPEALLRGRAPDPAVPKR